MEYTLSCLWLVSSEKRIAVNGPHRLSASGRIGVDGGGVLSLTVIDSSMVIREPNSVVASCPNFILEILLPSISAVCFLFSLSVIRCVSSIRRVRSSICLMKFSFFFCIASSMARVELFIAPVVEAVLIVSILSFRGVDMILIEFIESELSLLFELETLDLNLVFSHDNVQMNPDFQLTVVAMAVEESLDIIAMAVEE